MSLALSKRFVIQSPINTEELSRRLQAETWQGQRALFTKRPSTYFEGYVTPSQFEISRMPEGKNSFVPIVKGQITQTGVESHVKVVMRLTPFLIAFISIWLSGVLFGILVMAVQCISSRQFNPAILIPVFMFVFGYGLTAVMFNSECENATNKLLKIFEGKIVSNKATAA